MHAITSEDRAMQLECITLPYTHKESAKRFSNLGCGTVKSLVDDVVNIGTLSFTLCNSMLMILNDKSVTNSCDSKRKQDYTEIDNQLHSTVQNNCQQITFHILSIRKEVLMKKKSISQGNEEEDNWILIIAELVSNILILPILHQCTQSIVSHTSNHTKKKNSLNCQYNHVDDKITGLDIKYFSIMLANLFSSLWLQVCSDILSDINIRFTDENICNDKMKMINKQLIHIQLFKQFMTF